MHHEFADAALTNVNAELEQFTVDAGCAGWVVSAHSGDQAASRTPGQGANGRTKADLKSEQEK